MSSTNNLYDFWKIQTFQRDLSKFHGNLIISYSGFINVTYDVWILGYALNFVRRLLWKRPGNLLRAPTWAFEGGNCSDSAPCRRSMITMAKLHELHFQFVSVATVFVRFGFQRLLPHRRRQKKNSRRKQIWIECWVSWSPEKGPIYIL